MNRVLSFLKARTWGIVFFLVIVAVNFLFAQDSQPATPSAFDLVLLIPLVLGILAHWLKSYSRGQTNLNLWQYLTQGISLTLTTVIGSIATLIGMVAANPAGYEPVTFTVLFNVFLLGFSADSAVGGTVLKVDGPPKQ